MDKLSLHAYTVRLFAPEFTADEVEILSVNLLDSELLVNRRPITSAKGDQITVTFVEGLLDIHDHLQEVLNLARVGLRDTGIDRPVITQVFATPVETTSPLDAHLSVVMDTPLLDKVELTDQLLRDEL